MDDLSPNLTSFPATTPARPSLLSKIPIRHPDISFSDGTISFLDVSRTYYFNVHKGLICRHSAPLCQVIEVLVERGAKEDSHFIEGNLVLELDDEHEDLARFLIAFYDGVSELKYDVTDFHIVSSVLRLSTKYRVDRIRADILRGMAVAWPKTLAGWEFREADATDHQGNYRPRTLYPHPILVINLARQTNAPDLLPSAFYDLCRCTASEITSGCTLSPPQGGPAEIHTLSEKDLFQVLRGREYTSRFLSTFVATELEGRQPSANCLNANSVSWNTSESIPDASRKRICQATFEATTFEILRDVYGVVFHRNSDPLFALVDADFMQASQRSGSAPVLGSPGNGNTSDQSSNGRLGELQPACEPCRTEFSNVVDAAREDIWHRLPHWFGIESIDWP